MDHDSASDADLDGQEGLFNPEAGSDGASPDGQHGFSNSQQTSGDQSSPLAVRRIACNICRKRKLKCDGARPSCHSCSRLGHKCGYDDVRRKSGPKRGYVKELETRLKAVESLLKSEQKTTQTGQQSGSGPAPVSSGGGLGASIPAMLSFTNADNVAAISSSMGFPDIGAASQPSAQPRAQSGAQSKAQSKTAAASDFPWEMIGLGLEEPLPPQDMIDELHQVYFDKLHYTMPIIHKYRYLAAMNLAPNMRPAICLRYSIWALSCSVIDKYMSYSDIFYQRARKYLERDEMKGHGETFVTVGHCQSWIIMALFEFKMLYFPRAWMSSGRSTRLATMLNLHRQDGPSLEVKQTLPPPRDWTEKEERRRTLWLAYCVDRYASVGTGWPMSLDELDISTNLPASNEAFENSRPEQTLTLSEAMTPDGAAKLSSFAGVVVMACLFGKNLTHLHRANDSDTGDDLDGEFWKRHHKLDNILMTTAMFLPDHLKLHGMVNDPNVVTLNLYIHSVTICLHQAAILKAEKHRLGANIIRESTNRCFMAATEICALMKLVSPLEVAYMNPFMAFCLYVAARVFSHSYAKRPDNQNIKNSLFFLVAAMQAHRSKNNLTESFLVQIQMELDAASLEHPLHNQTSYHGMKTPQAWYEDGQNCPPIFVAPTTDQPSFHDIHSQQPEIAPETQARTQGQSPQEVYQAAFSVPTRERLVPRFNPGQQRQTPSPAWGDRSTPESHNKRFTNAGLSPESSGEHQSTPGTSHRASSTKSVSPHLYAESGAKYQQQSQPLEFLTQMYPTSNDAFSSMQDTGANMQEASGFDSVAQSYSASMGMGVTPDWGLDPVVELDDAVWTMDGMSWETGPSMQAGTEPWPSVSSTAEQ